MNSQKKTKRRTMIVTVPSSYVVGAPLAELYVESVREVHEGSAYEVGSGSPPFQTSVRQRIRCKDAFVLEVFQRSSQ